MAETLTLGTPKKFTLDATAGDVTLVTVPTGTRTLKITSAEAVYLEVSEAADSAVGTPSLQFKYEAGTFSDRLPGMGVTSQGALTADTVYRFVGTSSSQEVWMWAVAEV